MNIGGEERPLKFGFNQSIFYCEQRGITITQMNVDLTKISTDMGVFRDTIWSALKEGARQDGKEFDHTVYDVGDWLQEIEAKEVTGAINELTGSMPKAKKKVKPKPYPVSSQ